MKRITAYMQPDEGVIKVCGEEVREESIATKKKIGYLPELNPLYPDMYVREYLHFIGGLHQMKSIEARTEEVIQLTGLSAEANKQIHQLSKGYKQRVGLAAAIIHEPDVLILDEPTAGVDIELRRSMWEFLQELNRNGTTIILTTHYLEEAESLCRNIAIINQGQIVENTSMRKLLDKLARQTLIFDTCDELKTLPAFNDSDIQCNAIDSHSFEVSLSTSRDINGLYAALSDQGVLIKGMRNKTNRLEELFLSSLKS
jgi:ABC-2 type transport system ATP-binding protein